MGNDLQSPSTQVNELSPVSVSLPPSRRPPKLFPSRAITSSKVHRKEEHNHKNNEIHSVEGLPFTPSLLANPPQDPPYEPRQHGVYRIDHNTSKSEDPILSNSQPTNDDTPEAKSLSKAKPSRMSTDHEDELPLAQIPRKSHTIRADNIKGIDAVIAIYTFN